MRGKRVLLLLLLRCLGLMARLQVEHSLQVDLLQRYSGHIGDIIRVMVLRHGGMLRGGRQRVRHKRLLRGEVSLVEGGRDRVKQDVRGVMRRRVARRRRGGGEGARRVAWNVAPRRGIGHGEARLSPRTKHPPAHSRASAPPGARDGSLPHGGFASTARRDVAWRRSQTLPMPHCFCARAWVRACVRACMPESAANRHYPSIFSAPACAATHTPQGAVRRAAYDTPPA